MVKFIFLFSVPKTCSIISLILFFTPYIIIIYSFVERKLIISKDTEEQVVSDSLSLATKVISDNHGQIQVKKVAKRTMFPIEVV